MLFMCVLGTRSPLHNCCEDKKGWHLSKWLVRLSYSRNVSFSLLFPRRGVGGASGTGGMGVGVFPGGYQAKKKPQGPMTAIGPCVAGGGEESQPQDPSGCVVSIARD